jgi:hypothetical protein
VIEYMVGTVLILAGAVAVFLGIPPVSWAGLTFFAGGLALIATGVRQLVIGRRLRRSGS